MKTRQWQCWLDAKPAINGFQETLKRIFRNCRVWMLFIAVFSFAGLTRADNPCVENGPNVSTTSTYTQTSDNEMDETVTTTTTYSCPQNAWLNATTIKTHQHVMCNWCIMVSSGHVICCAPLPKKPVTVSLRLHG